MKVEYDPQADAIYIYLQRKPVYKSKELSPGVILDIDRKGHVIGLEILDASQKITKRELVNFSVKTLA